MSFLCQFCNKLFSTKYTLSSHQKKTKSCLKIQKEEFNINTDENYKCEYCSIYTSHVKHNYDRHIAMCKKKEESIENIIKNKELIKKDTRIELLEQELAIEKRERENQQKTIDDLQKALLKATTNKTTNNNNYITYQKQNHYSMKTLHPYTFLKDKLPDIINEHFTKSLFNKGIDGVCMLIMNYILNYDNKQYYQSFDKAGSVFNRIVTSTAEEEYDGNQNDGGNQIDIDEKANKLLNDICPLIIKRSTNIYNNAFNIESESSEDAKIIKNLASKLHEIKRLNIQGSKERNECVKRIAQSNYVSLLQLKSYYNSSIPITESYYDTSSDDMYTTTIDEDQYNEISTDIYNEQ